MPDTLEEKSTAFRPIGETVLYLSCKHLYDTGDQVYCRNAKVIAEFQRVQESLSVRDCQVSLPRVHFCNICKFYEAR